MKIIVVGCGKIGTALLAGLVAEGHDVVAIDNSPAVITEITNIYDAIGACGSGTDCELLSQAEVETADLFIAVTGSDELNMLSCYIAKSMGAKYTVARIRNPEYNEGSLDFLRRKLGISLAINPERVIARELDNLLKFPSAAKIEVFSGRNLEIVELKLKDNSRLDGMSLMEIRKKYPYNFLVCVVQRDEEVYIPDGTFVLKSKDKIGLTASPAEIQKLLKSLGLLQKEARDIMLVGASNIAYYLTKRLISSGHNVKIVDINEERCKEFSEKLPEAVVIHGDGAQQELLLEEGLDHMDAFVSLTGIDEENILLSYFAQTRKVPKVISKINREEFSIMAEQLGLDTVVSPRKSIVDILVRYARALEYSKDSSMETLYKVANGNAEALEFIIRNDCNLINIPLKDIPLNKNTLIAGIIRGKKSIIPAGDDVILPGDKVIILSTGRRINNISDIVK